MPNTISWPEGALSVLELRVSHQTHGFPSPAEDFAEARLSLQDLLVRHPEATYFFRMEGDALAASGILAGDILVVDRALTPLAGSIVIATCRDDLLARRYQPLPSGDGFALLADASHIAPIQARADGEVTVWGVVTFAVHAVSPAAGPLVDRRAR